MHSKGHHGPHCCIRYKYRLERATTEGLGRVIEVVKKAKAEGEGLALTIAHQQAVEAIKKASSEEREERQAEEQTKARELTEYIDGIIMNHCKSDPCTWTFSNTFISKPDPSRPFEWTTESDTLELLGEWGFHPKFSSLLKFEDPSRKAYITLRTNFSQHKEDVPNDEHHIVEDNILFTWR